MADDTTPEDPREASRKLSEEDIVTRRTTRRRLVWALGMGLVGTGAAAFSRTVSGQKKSDFPKGTSDGDVSKLADLKQQDRDENNGFADDDVSRLRDVRRSRDSD